MTVIRNIKITSSSMLWLIPHMNRVLPPWTKEKKTKPVPSQTWYFTEAANWMLSNRNIESPLKTGKRSRERHASANRPNLVATLKYLSCHLKILQTTKLRNSVLKSWNIWNWREVLQVKIHGFDRHQLLEIIINANIKGPS